MIPIEDYIKMDVNARRVHLKLDEPCLERGGPQNGGLSSYCKGLLAHIHDTTIPSGYKIHVCHACNNGRCSNPNHLYWGTSQENRIESNQPDPWQIAVARYGYEEACRRNSRGNKSAGGRANRGVPKTEEHRRKLSEASKKSWEERKTRL